MGKSPRDIHISTACSPSDSIGSDSAENASIHKLSAVELLCRLSKGIVAMTLKSVGGYGIAFIVAIVIWFVFEPMMTRRFKGSPTRAGSLPNGFPQAFCGAFG